MEPLHHDDPDRIGGFRLLRRLGGGGMGTVYLARSERGRTVALKTVHAEIADRPEFRTRFHLEADVARVIGARHGAAVVDADPLAETPWLATAYVLGPSLAEAVERYGPLPPAAVRAIGAALCRALTLLHESGIVHRDLKPSNILLTATGPKLIDFGIARAVGDERLTQLGAAVAVAGADRGADGGAGAGASAGVVAGTPAFMSPEQAEGAEHEAAGDVFALAGVLLFAATGRAPFGRGQASELMYRVRHTEPNLAGVPVGLGPVLHRCFAKDPAERPDAAELERQLRHVPAPPTGAGGPADPRLPQADEAGEPGRHDSGFGFAEVLPRALLRELTRSGTGLWDARPERSPAPAEPAGDTPPAPTGRVTRRALLGVGGAAAAVVVAGGWGAWARWGPDGTAAGGTDGRGPRTPGDAPTGPPRLAWRHQVALLPGTGVRPVADLLVMATEKGLVALDVTDGRTRWTARSGSRSQDPLTDGTRLFTARETTVAGDRRGLEIVPVDLRTGRLGDGVAVLPEVMDIGLRFVSLVGDRLVLVVRKQDEPYDSRTLLGVDLRTGKPYWEQSFTAEDKASPELRTVPAGDRIIVHGLRITAVDGASGELAWSVRLPKARTGATENLPGVPVVTGHRVVAGTGELVALDLGTGTVVWRFGEGRDFADDIEPAHRRYSPPAAVDGVVHVCERSPAGLLALDVRTGKLSWAEQEPSVASALDLAPVVGEKYVYTDPSAGRLWAHAVEPRTGRTVWDFQGPRASTWRERMLLHRGHLVMQRDTTLCAIRTE